MGVHIGESIRNAIRSKGLTMDEAADKLSIGKTQLYDKLKIADREPEFVQLVEERLGINIDMPERSSHVVGVKERVVGSVTMRYHTIPLKGRIGEAWLPSDLNKVDVISIRKWLDLIESNL